MDIYIPSENIIALYKVIPWDYEDEYYFATFLNAEQYAEEHFGMRYDLIEL